MSAPFEGEEDEGFDLDANDIVQVIDVDENAQNEESDSEEEAGAMEAETKLDECSLTFLGHTDTSVICTKVSPVDSSIAVTGGQDDQALVWNTKDGSILFQCTGHVDTVISVGFSYDGKYVVTADMKGVVKAWQVDNGQMVWSFETTDIEWTSWHNAAPVLLVGTKTGEIWMFQIPSGNTKTFASFGSGSVCGTFLPDGQQACVGYEDGSIKIWSLKSQYQRSVQGHAEAVLCMDCNKQGSLLITGSADMTAKLVNTASSQVLSTLTCERVSEEQDDSVETVGISSIHDFAITGTLGGKLQIWDISTQSVRQSYQHPAGVVKALWSPSSPILYTSCLDGALRKFDARDGHVVQEWRVHHEPILDFDLASDESLVITVSDDSTAKVISLPQA